MFHVSLLRKCLKVPESPNAFTNIDHRTIDLNQDLSYQERPLCIFDEEVRQTRRRKIKFFKVQWTNHTPEEATWEREDYLRTEFPDFYRTRRIESRDEILSKGGRAVTEQLLYH